MRKPTLLAYLLLFTIIGLLATQVVSARKGSNEAAVEIMVVCTPESALKASCTGTATVQINGLTLTGTFSSVITKTCVTVICGGGNVLFKPKEYTVQWSFFDVFSESMSGSGKGTFIAGLNFVGEHGGVNKADGKLAGLVGEKYLGRGTVSHGDWWATGAPTTFSCHSFFDVFA